jgi:hypothetical protein
VNRTLVQSKNLQLKLGRKDVGTELQVCPRARTDLKKGLNISYKGAVRSYLLTALERSVNPSHIDSYF